MPRPTIKDLAAAANLSVTTINRVLHEPKTVKQVTRELVLEAAERIGFYGIGAITSNIRVKTRVFRLGILLLQNRRVFYSTLATALEKAAKDYSDHEISLRMEFMDDLSPDKIAERMLKLGENCDAISIVSAEHPIVSEAIGTLAEKGVPVYALISPLSARVPVGFVGIDSWKVGRTSAWAFDNLCRQPGKIGILVGSHRYRCQELNESGFRSYFREHERGFELLEPKLTFEDSAIAREQTEMILNSHPDLVGLYISGGGITGAIKALNESGRAKQLVTVGYDMTEITRSALLSGVLNFVVAHPLATLAHQLISAMIKSVISEPETAPLTITLPFDIFVSESI